MTEPLIDPFDRVVRDLRISITDRCNFRCTYCMPEEGMDWLPRQEILTFEEIERVARLCVERFGFTGIRLTGGEPTVRSHLPVLVEKLSRLGVDLAMTTNGATMALMANDLKRAGLKRINISLDSLQRERFLALTKRDRIDEVLAGIDASIAAGFEPVKLNVVLMRGVNDDEIVDFAHFGRQKGIGIRFIEWMPLDAQGAWNAETVVTYDEIVRVLSAEFPIEPLALRGSQPAERFRYLDGAPSEIGVIASVTRSFCGDCDRVRLTAEGEFRNCLFAVDETDLRALLRGGASDDEVAEAIKADVGTKWAGHSIGQVTFIKPPRSMSQIGG
jgi:cyclic pyranopterin phosphate synthase